MMSTFSQMTHCKYMRVRHGVTIQNFNATLTNEEVKSTFGFTTQGNFFARITL